jgi:hypothetical protein
VPVAHAAEIRSGSRGNLLRQLVAANVGADLYGKELVRAIINVKWDSFARAFLLMQVRCGYEFVWSVRFASGHLARWLIDQPCCATAGVCVCVCDAWCCLGCIRQDCCCTCEAGAAWCCLG